MKRFRGKKNVFYVVVISLNNITYYVYVLNVSLILSTRTLKSNNNSLYNKSIQSLFQKQNWWEVNEKTRAYTLYSYKYNIFEKATSFHYRHVRTLKTISAYEKESYYYAYKNEKVNLKNSSVYTKFLLDDSIVI